MRVAIYCRVSTLDQHPENQELDLEQTIAHRGWQLVARYKDHGVSGATTKRPQLDLMMHDARRGKFDVVLVSAFDRMARSTAHLLHVLDELQQAKVQFISLREGVDTNGALGKAILTIVAAIGELERNLIIERVKSGMRRAKAEGKQVGRKPIEIPAEQFTQDRKTHSLSQLALKYGCSRSTIANMQRVVREGVSKSTLTAAANKAVARQA